MDKEFPPIAVESPNANRSLGIFGTRDISSNSEYFWRFAANTDGGFNAQATKPHYRSRALNTSGNIPQAQERWLFGPALSGDFGMDRISILVKSKCFY